ncbi:MAG: Flp pilus assembly complex ATPase component TadA, partial [Oscillospiraceae bacterium]|nr:Flp pilus assembly complex ATPase component TadA [Oscillospiraceae bacterium]
MADTEKIEGTVDTVRYRNEDNGYAVLFLESDGELVTVTGDFGDIEEGEGLTAYGHYASHPRYGPQFITESFERKLPDTADSIRRYLSSGVIKGIGEALANRIVDVFGARTLTIMEHEPERLLEVRGMTERKCEEVAREAKQIFSLRSAIAYFDGYGIRSRYAMRAYRIWGEQCQEVVAENPYLMCRDTIGLGFRQVEDFARELHIPLDAPCRIQAGIEHLLSFNANEGHSCLPLDRLSDKACYFLGIGESEFYRSYNAGLEEGTIVEYVKDGREFVYLKEYYDAEDYIATRIGVMRDFGIRDTRDYSELIEETERNSGMQYAELQKEAIRSALSRGMLILTGGPGTGKTTTLNAIIACFEKLGNQVLIAAPTG